MFTGHDVLLLMVLPFVVAIAAMALAWRRKSSGRAKGGGGWALTLAMAGGVLAAGLAEFHPKGKPAEAMDWLVVLPALALIAGLLADLLPWWAAIGMVSIAGVGETGLIALLLPAGSVPWMVMALLAVAPGIVYGLLRPLVRKRPGPGLVWMFFMIAGVTVIVESAGTFIQFGQYTVALAAALTGVLLGRLMLRRPNVSAGSFGAFVLVWMGMLVFGYLWADVPAWRTVVLGLAPLAAWGAEIPRSLRPFWRATLRLALVAVPLAVVVAPAAMELVRLMRSQTEVGGY